MKKKVFRHILLFIIASVFLGSCIEVAYTDDEYVNKWIYDEMSTWYLWNTNLPKKPDYSLKPEPFFESLLYNKGQATGDRFSWIQDNYLELLNSLSGVTPYDIGFEYIGYLKAEGSTDIICQIAYVKPNTNAEAIGLKRGDYFTKVNGTTLNTSNWRSILSASETSATITFINMSTNVTTDKLVSKHANFAENPLFFDHIYEDSGHKIGYLVYNFFASGPKQGNYSYDTALNNVFGRFKSAAITELVLDLRYNNGGSMNSALLLGSMIVPNLNTNNIFIKVQYNSLLEAELVKEYGQDFLIDKLRDKLNTGETINNVGNTVQKLYVLTGNWTASASELVINGLIPYMPGKVFLIGNKTVGKNVGSISLYQEKDKRNKWGMQPIILRYFNKDGKSDFVTGFVPDIEERDSGTKLELGNPEERMLKIAIDHITGRYVPTKVSYDSDKLSVGSSIEQKAWANRTIVDDALFRNLFQP